MKSKTKNSKPSKNSSNGGSQKQQNPHFETVSSVLQSTAQHELKPGTGLDITSNSSELLQDTTGTMHHKDLDHHESMFNPSNGYDEKLEYPAFTRKAPTTSMETEYIEALYSDFSGTTSCSPSIGTNTLHEDGIFMTHSDLDLPPNSASESDEIDYEDMESYNQVQAEDGDCEDFDDDLDVYEHDDFLSSQEAILMELRREQVEFEENVRQLQQQLQRQGSLLPLTSNHGENIARDKVFPNIIHSTGVGNGDDSISVEYKDDIAQRIDEESDFTCSTCKEPTTLCLEKYVIWRPAIIEALATAAAAIANFHAHQHENQESTEQSLSRQKALYNEFLPKHRLSLDCLRETLGQYKSQDKTANGETTTQNSNDDYHASQTAAKPYAYWDTNFQSPARYPLPPNSPYKFRKKSSEFLEPVGEHHEFQSAEGNSRQVLLHVWPPSELDTPLLNKLEACCRDFQENDVVQGHSGDGFLNGWRPSWKDPSQTGVLRFGHWRVRAPSSQGMRLYVSLASKLFCVRVWREEGVDF
ncbi:hypothetical protein BGZ46_003711 [Entomortierella lignicola]|nr:hypothetical protein BGZ46_003711 [Entomortierella lignicola]